MIRDALVAASSPVETSPVPVGPPVSSVAQNQAMPLSEPLSNACSIVGAKTAIPGPTKPVDLARGASCGNGGPPGLDSHSNAHSDAHSNADSDTIQGNSELSGSAPSNATLLGGEKNSLDAECVICLEDLCPGDKVGRLECLCVFHYKCIKDWFNKKSYAECPVHFLHS
ncbi:hypothetical protein JCM33374_g3299 [Metschnikowia sp. JCM 33374]|nr:hypothetical protein JCM33374_g3299 [Metschnikowia sp. JCM 33374]